MKEKKKQPVKPVNGEQQRIAQWLKKVKFKKQFFGGVNEKDVWKKIAELNDMYNVAIACERARYDALLEQQSGAGKSTGEAVQKP